MTRYAAMLPLHSAEEIDVHDTAKIVNVAIAEFPDSGDRGIVEDEIKPPMPGGDIVHDSLHVQAARNVQRHRFRLGASGR